MVTFRNTDTTSILGWPVPDPGDGGAWVRGRHPVCATADGGSECAKYASECLGYCYIWREPFNRAFTVAMENNGISEARNWQLLQGQVKLLGVATQGIRRWTDTIVNQDPPPDTITDHNLGNELNKGNEVYAKIWKDYGPWEVDTGASSLNYFVCNFTEGTLETPGNDPAFSTDNDGTRWSLDGWFEARLGNSKQSHTARFIIVGLEYGLDGAGKFRLWCNTPIEGSRWSTPADGHSGAEEEGHWEGDPPEWIIDVAADPHDPITITLTCLDAGGREIWSEPPTVYSLRCKPFSWEPPTWPMTETDYAFETGKALAPHMEKFPRKAYLKIDGQWVEEPSLLTRLNNILQVGTPYYYEGHLDALNFTLASEGLKIEGWLVDPTNTAAMPICASHCAWSKINRRRTLGIKAFDGDASAWCEKIGELTAAEALHYERVNGMCRNEACQFWALYFEVRDNTAEVMAGLLQSRYAVKVQSAPGVNQWNLFVIGHPGLGELWGEELAVTDGYYEKQDYVGGTGSALGTMKEFFTVDGGVGVTQVKIVPGFEVLDDEDYADEPGPGGDNKVDATINYGNIPIGDTTYAGISNDYGGQFTNSLTTGPSGQQKVDRTQVGELGRRVEYRMTWLLLPQMSTTVGWHRDIDADYKIGFWTIDLEEQDAEDENTVYYVKVQMHSTTRQVKSLEDRKPPAYLGTVTGKSTFATGVTGCVGLNLRHRYESLAKPAGTGNPDAINSVKISGRNVLPKFSERIKNYAAYTCLSGPGAGGDLCLPGRALRVTSGPLKGRILPIVAAVPCYQGTGHAHDEDFALAQNQAYLENAYGLIGNVADYENCDAVWLLDEAATLSALGEVDRVEFELIECAYAMPYAGTKFYVTGVGVERQEIAGPRALYNSGTFYFPIADPECIAMYVAVARAKPPLHGDNDRDVFADAIEKGIGN